jgi:hypothetical protein
MNTGNAGSFNRLIYDNCETQKRVAQSTGSFGYQMYAGKYENSQKCVANQNHNYRPFDPEIVSRENDIRNISRQASKCAEHQYNPNCRSKTCISTFDPSNPIVMPPEACPIIRNNLVRPTNPGYTMSSISGCEVPRHKY